MSKVNHTHCCYCRRRFSEAVRQLKCTVDHFWPTSRLGLNVALNKLQSCQECNSWKADKLPTDWLREVERVNAKNKKPKGTYQRRDYAQIIGSLKHFIALLKHSEISEYKL